MRFALPKGRLLAGVTELLARAGLTFAFDNDRDYSGVGSVEGTSGKLIKARAVPQMVALGNFEVGFCGIDLVRESDYEQVQPLLDLQLNAVTIVVAVPRARAGILANPPRRPLLIATEYERLADAWAFKQGLAHITIQTHGSTEAYVPEDADIIVECVETGRTLEANGLVVVEQLFRSTTHLVANRMALADPHTGAEIRHWVQQLRGVL